MYYFTTYNSFIGELTLACDNKNNLIGLWMKNQKYFGGTISNKMMKNDNMPIFIEGKRWLDRYFNKENPDIKELSLKPIGSTFRQEVWQLLVEIPYGQLKTYKDIAKTLAEKKDEKTMSARAIGGAVGHNPISIIIPCHRVIGTNKSLTGFSGGIDKKLKLLEHEGIDISNQGIKGDKKI